MDYTFQRGIVFCLIAGAFFVALAAFASPESKIVQIPQSPDAKVEVGDLVCMKLPEGEDECGKVVSASDTDVLLEVEMKAKDTTPANDLASVQSSVEKTALPQDRESRFLSGMALGTNFYYLNFQIEREVVSRWSVGLSPVASLGSGQGASVTVFGGFLQADYRPNLGDGLEYTGGLGLFQIAATPTYGSKANLTALSVFAGAGYSWTFSKFYFLLPRLVVQYISPLAGDAGKVKFSGVKPTLLLSAGIKF